MAALRCGNPLLTSQSNGRHPDVVVSPSGVQKERPSGPCHKRKQLQWPTVERDAAVLLLYFLGCLRYVLLDVNKVNEICQLETMEARCRWNSEVIVMTSARWGRMKTGRCLNIHPKRLASNSNDPMFIGCSEDVLSLLDMKCSLKPACNVLVPNDLDKITPCYEDLTRYLEASYTCVKGNPGGVYRVTLSYSLFFYSGKG